MVLIFWFDECFLVCFSSNDQILPSFEHQTKQSQRLQMRVALQEPLGRIESHYCILRVYFWFILINSSTLNPTLTAEHSLGGGGFPQPGCLWSERVKKVSVNKWMTPRLPLCFICEPWMADRAATADPSANAFFWEHQNSPLKPGSLHPSGRRRQVNSRGWAVRGCAVFRSIKRQICAAPLWSTVPHFSINEGPSVSAGPLCLESDRLCQPGHKFQTTLCSFPINLFELFCSMTQLKSLNISGKWGEMQTCALRWLHSLSTPQTGCWECDRKWTQQRELQEKTLHVRLITVALLHI